MYESTVKMLSWWSYTQVPQHNNNHKIYLQTTTFIILCVFACMGIYKLGVCVCACIAWIDVHVCERIFLGQITWSENQNNWRTMTWNMSAHFTATWWACHHQKEHLCGHFGLNGHCWWKIFKKLYWIHKQLLLSIFLSIVLIWLQKNKIQNLFKCWHSQVNKGIILNKKSSLFDLLAMYNYIVHDPTLEAHTHTLRDVIGSLDDYVTL